MSCFCLPCQHLDEGACTRVAPPGDCGAAAAAQPEGASCEVFLTEFRDAALPLPTIITDGFQGAQPQEEASLSASFYVRCA